MARFLELMAAASVAALAVAQPASAAYSLFNTNGGDGYVTPITGGYDIFGSDDGTPDNFTAYLDTATKTQTLAFNYTYTTNDLGGSFFDPAGFYRDGTLFSVSPDSLEYGQSISGVFKIRVQAGQTFGFFIYSADSSFGRGDIAVVPSTATAGVPEPASWALMIAGFGLTGAAMRRRAVQPVRATA